MIPEAAIRVAAAVPAELRGPVYTSVSPLRALELLVVLGSASATEMAECLLCSQVTGRRVLNRLVEDGWARRIDKPRPRYELTGKLADLASQAHESAQRDGA
jgi:DNA-binding IclR family transcriptional regulator